MTGLGVPGGKWVCAGRALLIRGYFVSKSFNCVGCRVQIGEFRVGALRIPPNSSSGVALFTRPVTLICDACGVKQVVSPEKGTTQKLE